jgi:FKBP-type peptidyl-prolyl cis-trans isomerase
MKIWYPAVALMAAIACNNEITGLEPPSNPATETFAASLNVNISQMTKLPNGTYIQDLTVGTGAEITQKTDTIWATYAGFLKDGKLFDSGTNTKFVLPGDLVIGFSSGVVGMKVGGERLIVIPSEMGFGHVTRKQPGTNKILIPRQSTLVFRVTLLKLHTPATGGGTTA